MRAYELSKLYLNLPRNGEFRANHFAHDMTNAKRIGKMLTELEMQVY